MATAAVVDSSRLAEAVRLFLEQKARVQPPSLARPVGQLAYTRVEQEQVQVQLLEHVAAGEDTAENTLAARQA